MEIQEAIDEYIHVKKHETSDATIQNYGYRLKQFAKFCDRTGLTDTSELTARDLGLFKRERVSNEDINAYTAEQQLRTLRMFIRWCESNELIDECISDKMIIPQTDAHKQVRNEAMGSERANKIIDHLWKYDYASRQHVLFHLLWETGMRLGEARALDTRDWKPDDGYLAVRHRPETDTPLKQKEKGQRNITITDDRLRHALDDYIEDMRHDVEDDFGREPLLTTKRGRAHTGTLRADVYKVVQPCRYSRACPHDEEIDSCEFRNYDKRSGCPSSIYPHAIRSGAVTAHLNENVPKEIVTERANMSEEVLEKHYDERTLEDRRERRERYL